MKQHREYKSCSYMEVSKSDENAEEVETRGQGDNARIWTSTRILNIVGLTATQFFSYTSVFILSSFYPPLAEEKKISGIELGLIIGIIQGVFTFGAYSFVQITHIVSPKAQVVSGLVVTGLATVVFGFLDHLPDGMPFFGACLGVRIVQGIGIAASDLCVLIIANQITPQKLLGTVIGVLELSLAAAIAVSPAIGGYLFQAGGFYLPFLVSGATSVLSAVFCFFVLPTSKPSKGQQLQKILRNSASFDMLVYITYFTLGGGFSGFFAGIIEPHLRKFDLQPGEMGLVILITNAISGITFPLWGYATDKLKAATTVTLLGSALTAIGFILFGPFPYLPIESTLVLVCGSLVLCGCGISAVLISAYTAAKEYLTSSCKDEELANTVLASSYPSTYSIGAFLGGILGGMFVDWIGFREGSAILFGLQLFGVFLHLLLMAKRRVLKKMELKKTNRSAETGVYVVSSTL